MKKNVVQFITIIAVLLFSSSSISFAQNPKPDKPASEKWIRVESDDGEFSIEVPTKYNYFYDAIGFSVSYSRTDYPLAEMQMLNSISDGNLLSFERYKGSKVGLQSIYEMDTARAKNGKTREFKVNGATIKEFVNKTDFSFSIRQYFFSKNHVYILTAANRIGETDVIRRFLDSLIFKPNANETVQASNLALSKLPISTVKMEYKQDANVGNPTEEIEAKDADKKPSPDSASKKLTIISKPIPSYTVRARDRLTSGSISLRVSFGADGFPNHLVVLTSLSEGLQRQAIMCAMRIKYLPAEKAGISTSVDKTVQYSFATY